MIGIALALFSAFSWGIATVLIRQKLKKSNIISATAVSTVISGLIIWPLALLFTNLETVSFEGVLFFALAGLIAPGITNLIYNKGMDVVGVSVSASIFATYPMYSSIFAIILLSESVIFENFIGIILIIIGVLIIERGMSKPKTPSKINGRKGLIFPLLASLTMAFSFIPRKHGLNIYNAPLLAAAIGFLSSSLFYFILSKSSRSNLNSLFSRKDVKLFWKAGFFMSLGSITTLFALSSERVSLVTPIMQTEPLFVLFFAYLFLKELEQRSSKLLMGTITIIIGVILVSL
jgi:drug/metabolite transporter (DMT)-like permease